MEKVFLNGIISMDLKYVIGSIIISGLFVYYTQTTERQIIVESEDEEEPDRIEYIKEDPSLYTYISTMVIMGGLAVFFTSYDTSNVIQPVEKVPERLREYIRSGPADF